MFSFTKKEKILCIKLYKVVTLEMTKMHKTKDLIYTLFEYFSTNFDLTFEYFDVNYGFKEFRTNRGFSNYLEKVDDSILSYISMINKNENIVFTVNLPFRNYLKGKEPQLSDIYFKFKFCNYPFENFKIVDLVNTLIIKEQLDYGYFFETDNLNYLDWEYKSSLFKKDIGFELNVLWNRHLVGINYGYLKKLYKYNFINESQMNQPIVKKSFNQKIGKFERVNENITLWQLDDQEFKIASNFFKSTPWLMCDENCYELFQNSVDAKLFKSLMK